MPVSERDRLAAVVAKRYSAFEKALFGNKRKYPLREFQAFWDAGRRYAELTKSDLLIRRTVVEVVHGLRDIVEWGSKRIPDYVPTDASVWNVSYSAGTIPISRATSRPGCRALAGL
jgi:hypothetical protein